jgi:hypothetical protein
MPPIGSPACLMISEQVDPLGGLERPAGEP